MQSTQWSLPRCQNLMFDCAKWQKEDILVLDCLINIFVLHFHFHQTANYQSICHLVSEPKYPLFVPRHDKVWPNETCVVVWFAYTNVSATLLLHTMTENVLFNANGFALMSLSDLIKLRQKERKIKSNSCTTTLVPRRSNVTSCGHVLKVESDEKQSNTLWASLLKSADRGAECCILSKSTRGQKQRPPLVLEPKIFTSNK